MLQKNAGWGKQLSWTNSAEKLLSSELNACRPGSVAPQLLDYLGKATRNFYGTNFN